MIIFFFGIQMFIYISMVFSYFEVQKLPKLLTKVTIKECIVHRAIVFHNYQGYDDIQFLCNFFICD